MEDLVANLVILALPVVLAITLHEAAHGYVARAFGDPTAHLAGRISLNPLRHIDPVGTVAVPLTIYLIGQIAGQGGLLFGWAKPVPVDFSRLRHPKSDMFWVAAAGPGANLAMALGWAVIAKLALAFPGTYFGDPLRVMASAGIMINVVLMVLNLLPIPPLDGGRIAVSLLPHRLAYQFARLEPFGFPLLLVLLFTGALRMILLPPVDWVRLALAQLFQF